MVVAIKEHVLIGIMQQSLKCRYRLAFKARQAGGRFVCACPDQPTCHGIAEGDDGIVGYVTRMSGLRRAQSSRGVGGAISDGRYPYLP